MPPVDGRGHLEGNFLRQFMHGSKVYIQFRECWPIYDLVYPDKMPQLVTLVIKFVGSPYFSALTTHKYNLGYIKVTASGLLFI